MEKMLITKNIVQAIIKAREYYGGNYTDLEKITGISAATFGQYVNGEIKETKHATWKRIEPVLRRWLPEHENAVKETSPPYGTPIPQELHPLIHAWSHLCDMQKQIILGVVKTILDDQKKETQNKNQKIA